MNRFLRIVALAHAFVFGAVLPASADGMPHAGDVAPPFSVARASGGTIRLSDYRGKPLYLNFFATWCPPCNAEAPSVAGFYAKYRTRGLTVLGVNELEDKDKALGFARRYKWPFPIAVDGGGDLGRRYGALGLPVHVFVNRAGRVSVFRLGEMSPGDIEAAIKTIL